MFTAEDIQALLHARPFVPFRMRLSDGDTLDLRHQEQVFVTRRLAVIGIPDPGAKDTLADRFTIFW